MLRSPSTRWLRFVVPGALAALVLLGMDAPGPGPVAVPLPPSISAPAFLRVEVEANTERRIPLEVTLPQAATLLVAEVDCRCVSLVEPTPRPLPAGTSTLTLRVVGLLPGMKRVTLRTTAGSAEVMVQVAVPGADSGLSVLTRVVADAVANQERLIVIVHQLGGRLRNCGCSAGSLGGVDRLAALPAALRQLGAGDARCVLTGIVDGEHAGLGQALAARGWERNPHDLPISSDPVHALDTAGALAVIDGSTGSPIANQRIVKPLLDGGATATILLLAANGQLRQQLVVPIDRSLPADADILAAFPEPRSMRAIAEDQAQSCASCHPAAVQAWAASKHAHAWDSLTAENRVDACITCHSSPRAATADATARAQHVSCLACHQGAAAHAAAPQVHTTGTTDCRSCHDALHHPGFDRLAGWERIAHGK